MCESSSNAEDAEGYLAWITKEVCPVGGGGGDGWRTKREKPTRDISLLVRGDAEADGRSTCERGMEHSRTAVPPFLFLSRLPPGSRSRIG